MITLKMEKAYILFVLIALIGCDKKATDLNPLVASYPMTIGTEWTYERQFIINKYESITSDVIIKTDTLHFDEMVWIDKDTILNGMMNVTVFKSREEGYNWTSTSYKFIDNEGLKTFAYSNAGGPFVFAKKYGYIKSASLLNSIIEHSNHAGDNITFESKPTLDIKLPLDINLTWTYRYPTDSKPWQIDKKVLEIENLHLINQDFTCYKLEYIFKNESFNYGTKSTDWISDKGLIKRLTIVDRAQLVDDHGEPTGEFVHSTEILTLKGIKIR